MPTTAALRAPELVLPDAETPRQAQALEMFLRNRSESGTVKLLGPDGETVAVPSQLLQLLVAAAAVFAQGEGVALAAIDRELSTTEAASLLGMSRPSLIRLLDTDQIPSRKVGTHRRVQLRHLLEFRRARLEQQRKAYEDLMLEADALGLDD